MEEEPAGLVEPAPALKASERDAPSKRGEGVRYHCSGRFTPCAECVKAKKIRLKKELLKRRITFGVPKSVYSAKRAAEAELELDRSVIPLPGPETPGLKAEVVVAKTEEEKKAKIIRDLDDIATYMIGRIKEKQFQERLIKKPHSFFRELISLLVCRAKLVDGSSSGITIDLGSILERESKILAKLKDEFGDQADAIAKRFERVQNPKLGETGRRSETVVWPGDVDAGDAEE